MRALALTPFAFVLAASSAHAQEGPLGRVPNVVTVEGIATLAAVHTQRPGGSDATTDWTLGTLGGLGGLITSGPSLLRLGYHRVLGPVTLGSGLYYGTVQGTSQLTLAPRLGFVIPAGATTAIWPRVGVTYARQATDFEKASQTYAAGELLIVITPVSHFGVMFGPFIEAGLSSSVSTEQGRFGGGPTVSGDGPMVRVIGGTLGFLFDF